MNSNKNNPKYNGFQHLVLWAIIPLFLFFITLFVPDKNIPVKTWIFVIGIVPMGLVVELTSTNLSLLYNFSAWKSIICTAIVVLLIPSIMSVTYYAHHNTYLSSAPSNNQVSLRITADVKRTGGSGSIGGEWRYKHAINSNTFKSGDIVEINIKKPFNITSTIIENDEIDDVGTSISREYTYGITGDYTEEISLSNNVKVVERGGRKNSGAYATFTVNYTINRVVPNDYTFFDVYFFTNNEDEAPLLWGILLLGLGSVAYIVFIIYSGKKRETQLEEEKKAEEERKFQEEKKAFIASLKGKQLRDVAGVPSHIVYQNGMPIDNNNAEYGSFTVYLSSSGKCFHGSKGCCSAYRPAHYFTARQSYSPCSKCGSRYHNVPEWHTKYMDLKVTARIYGVDED